MDYRRFVYRYLCYICMDIIVIWGLYGTYLHTRLEQNISISRIALCCKVIIRVYSHVTVNITCKQYVSTRPLENLLRHQIVQYSDNTAHRTEWRRVLTSPTSTRGGRGVRFRRFQSTHVYNLIISIIDGRMSPTRCVQTVSVLDCFSS